MSQKAFFLITLLPVFFTIALESLLNNVKNVFYEIELRNISRIQNWQFMFNLDSFNERCLVTIKIIHQKNNFPVLVIVAYKWNFYDLLNKVGEKNLINTAVNKHVSDR